MEYTHKVVVIGAGISGLACAFHLRQLGMRPLVLEVSDRAGGVISTIRRNGFLFEAGPQCPRFPTALWELARELNLESEFVPGDPAAKRYILRRGHLHPAPFSPGGLLGTRLVGLGSKLRILSEAFRSSHPPAHEESLAEFIERKFGTEVLDYLVDPFISTIFLGDARRMGMESTFPALVEWERRQGSVARGAIRARRSKQNDGAPRGTAKSVSSHRDREGMRVTEALPSLGSFKAGMGTLPEKLAENLKDSIRYGAKIESIAPSRNEGSATRAGWQMRLATGEEIASDCLVLAVPAHAAARLMERASPQLASLLVAIEHAPMCVVSSAYNRSQVSHPLDGFGFMAPRRAGLHTICTFWNSSMFRGRAPDGTALMASFAGGTRDENLAALPEEECAQVIEAENAKVLGIVGPPVDRMVWRYAQALPQYNVGHAARVAEIQTVMRTLPNLRLAGNYLTGRSIGDCVGVAFRAADDLHGQSQT